MKLFLIFLACMMLFCWALYYAHEQVHVQIFESEGIKSAIHYEKGIPAYTMPEKNCETESCELAHNLNEIIGYPLMIFFILIGFGIAFIILAIEEKK